MKSKKLNLEKFRVTELNNPQAIYGGEEPTNNLGTQTRTLVPTRTAVPTRPTQEPTVA